MKLSLPAACLALLLAPALLTAAEDGSDWPQFRGPNANNVVEGDSHPAEWSESQNIAWEVPLEGRAWATPLITGGKVLLANAVAEGESSGRRGERAPHKWELVCLDLASGEKLWSKVAKEGVPSVGTHRDNTYASETPVTDGEHVYVYFGMTGLYCYDLDGNLVWQKDLGSYKMQADWGTSSSPALHEGRLFVQVDSEDQSFLVALDAKTGEELWRKDRDEGSNWSTPIIWKNKQRTELVTGGGKFRSYDPASGELLWTLDVSGSRSSASPSATEDLLIVGAEDRSSRGGGRGGVFAVKPGGQGDISPDADGKSDFLLWGTDETALGMSSPLIYDGVVYILARRGGIVNAFDASSGELLYRERARGASAFWASPWAAGGKIFLPNDRGGVHVLEPGSEYELVRTNEIPGRLWASTAVGDGSLILRYEDRVVCVRN
ncbi:outer membrane biogenesis protein BamB [Posidoniimonas polymericola]|uniref:Outer membrane biogenesis protein BamB n=1 Tax=Posidoniimonas polymericola TaxID=2528002 RepID=A0A5C5YTX9_9BACT|nr:PQQ-binding-like beta-propeller repeat protein [Posidoniimonas polymericola]TWT78206.1 outer membrane biogenesis protein BamB [Posidoniimonas polymericola]